MISTRDLVTAAVRLYALFVLLRAVGYAGAVAVNGLYPPGLSDPMQRREFILSSVSLVVLLAFVMLVLDRTKAIVGWVMRYQPAEHDGLAVSQESLVAVTLAIAGIVFVVSGLSDVTSHVAVWYFLPRDRYTGQRVDFPPNWPRVAGSVFQVIAGAALVLGRDGAIRLFHQVRRIRSLRSHGNDEDTGA